MVWLGCPFRKSVLDVKTQISFGLRGVAWMSKQKITQRLGVLVLFVTSVAFRSQLFRIIQNERESCVKRLILEVDVAWNVL